MMIEQPERDLSPDPGPGRAGSARGWRSAVGRPQRGDALKLFGTLLLLALSACATREAEMPAPESGRLSRDSGFIQKGLASWYGPRFHGRRTASGERFDRNELTAAHRTLPLGTVVTVRNSENGRSVSVRINDRGPYIRGRIIDLSQAAARQLGMLRQGTAPVVIELAPQDGKSALASSQ